MAESRKGSMNGANFFVSKSATHLINELFWYQYHFYVTDSDAMKIVCDKGMSYKCRFIHHRHSFFSSLLSVSIVQKNLFTVVEKPFDAALSQN